jgi:tetratricopeptide (TPR) repeat protein
MLVLLKNYPAALESLEKSRQLGGETAAYYWFRAIMQDALQQHKPALESYQRFLEMSHDKSPDEEFKARQRVRILTRIVNR